MSSTRDVLDALNRLTQVTLNGTVSLSVGYDALGNITSRSDVGSYTYHPTRKHAVTQAGSRAFTYDANGNMLTRSGQTLAWRGDDLPALIRDQASTGAPVYQSEFAYGPSGERWRQIATFSNGTETTISIGGLLEKSSSSSVPGTTHFRHWIPAPDGTLIQVEVTRNAGAGALTTRYITRDHLGSVDAVLSSTAAVLNRESFNAWGSRRSAAGWTGAPSAAEWSAIAGTLRQGYTSDATLHTQLDNLGLIHMNGRVLDPTLGRFISADPFVTDPFNSQSLNRFSYVLNNPNRFIDPSGFAEVDRPQVRPNDPWGASAWLASTIYPDKIAKYPNVDVIAVGDATLLMMELQREAIILDQDGMRYFEYGKDGVPTVMITAARPKFGFAGGSWRGGIAGGGDETGDRGESPEQCRKGLEKWIQGASGAAGGAVTGFLAGGPGGALAGAAAGGVTGLVTGSLSGADAPGWFTGAVGAPTGAVSTAFASQAFTRGGATAGGMLSAGYGGLIGGIVPGANGAAAGAAVDGLSSAKGLARAGTNGFSGALFSYVTYVGLDSLANRYCNR